MLHERVERRVRRQGLGDHLVVVALEAKSKENTTSSDSQFSAVRSRWYGARSSTRSCCRSASSRVAGLVKRADQPPRVEGHRSHAVLLAVLLQDELAGLPALELGHLRERFLNRVEEVQDRLGRVREVHLGVQVDVDPEVVAQVGVRIHGPLRTGRGEATAEMYRPSPLFGVRRQADTRGRVRWS